MGFDAILRGLRRGGRYARRNWYGSYIELQRPDVNSKMTTPYVYRVTGRWDDDEDRVPWVPTQEDMLAEDWRPYPYRLTPSGADWHRSHPARDETLLSCDLYLMDTCMMALSGIGAVP